MNWLDAAIVCSLLAGLAGLAGQAGCAADPADRPNTWSYLHAAIIAPNCATASCHGSLAATAGVVLDDADAAYDVLTDPKRNYVIPGDPGSTLVLLLEGDERPRMPPDAPLPRADIDLVRAWIEAGAPR